MKTKLRTLFILGIAIALSPLFYFSPTITLVLSILVGIFVMYLVWRIRIQYKAILLKARRYDESTIIQ